MAFFSSIFSLTMPAENALSSLFDRMIHTL
jgi:hypothetical protein